MIVTKPKLLLGLALILSGCLHGFCDEIHDAAAKGDLAKVKELIKADPNLVFSRTKEGDTVLLYAACSKNKELVEFLLANKADINDPGYNESLGAPGTTPLMEVCSLGYKDMVELLLAHGADIKAKSLTGETCLEVAAEGNWTDVMEVLLSHGSDINARNDAGGTALRSAAVDGKKEAVALLLANHAVIDGRDNFGMTPLIWAAYRGHKDVVELLLTKKADINALDYTGHTALHYAALNGHPEVVQLLLTNNAKLYGDGSLVNRAVHSVGKSGDMQSGQGSSSQEDKDAKLLSYHQGLADKGDAYGELRMGLRYRDGDGVPKDLGKAREWLRKSAEQGDPEAAAALSQLQKGE